MKVRLKIRFVVDQQEFVEVFTDINLPFIVSKIPIKLDGLPELTLINIKLHVFDNNEYGVEAEAGPQQNAGSIKEIRGLFNNFDYEMVEVNPSHNKS